MGVHMALITSALKLSLGIVVIVCLILIVVYLLKAGALYAQYANAYARWSSHKVSTYSISVIENKTGDDSGTGQSQIVQGGQIVQGTDPFGKPVIDWTFEAAQFCAPAWIVCDLLHWSFQYEPTWGYPTHVEYDDYDGHYFLFLKNLKPSENGPGGQQ